ncbi:MAG: Serine/threonine-protein kinase AfsK [Steroidobacteraceae bacterium]|nr:Serine/threonine-protein kinase AfsK [Steroidobacteraceae bacterium]
MRGGAAFLPLLCLASVADAQGTFHGDGARTGVYATSGPTHFSGVKWSFDTGGPIFASPVLAGNSVYIASASGALFALERDTGMERWRFTSRMPISSTPAIAGDTLYFVSSVGSLVALDPATGQPKWVFATEYERRFEAKGLHGYGPAGQTIPDAWDVFTSSPVVAEGKVYFGSGDGNVYAVDAASGVLQWKLPLRNVVHASPAYANGVIFIGSWGGDFQAIDAATGRPKWQFQAGEDPARHNQVGFQSSAAVVDGVVYVGCRDAHVYALDAKTGRKLWDYPTSKSWVNGTPAVRGGVVYVGTSDSSRFMALDAKTGRLRFNFDAKAYVFSSAALAGSLAYFGSHNGRLFAIDARTGDCVWTFQTDASKEDPLHLLDADGRLNAGGFAPVFRDYQDMYIDLYRFRSIGAILSSPAVDEGVVYVGSLDGRLYALH